MTASDVLVHSMDADLAEKHVVTACADGIIRIYSIEDTSMNLLSELPGHSSAVTKAIFINNGELIASADFSGKLIVWKLETNGFVKRAEAQVSSGPIYDISARFDGSTLKIFCGCDGGILKTIEYDNSFSMKEDSKEVHRYGISSVSSNMEYVITGGFDFAVGVHSKDGSEYLNHHQSSVNCVAVAPSNFMNKLLFATCSDEGKVFVISKEEGEFKKQIIELGQPVRSLDWSRSGFVLTVSYGTDGFKSFMADETGNFSEIQMEILKNE